MDDQLIYLSDDLVKEKFVQGTINLLQANCGSGKTTAAFKTIPALLDLDPNRGLYLIDTTAGEYEFVRMGYCNYYDKVRFEYDFSDKHDKPTVMTYAKFGSLIKQRQIAPSDYQYIVADEIHSLVTPIAISRGKLKKQFPQVYPWEINDMLKMTCFNYIAAEAIHDAAVNDNLWVFGLTATPQNLHYIQAFNQIINEVKISQQLHAYEIITSFSYSQIEPILRKFIPDSTKQLFYFNTVTELVKYRGMLIESGRKAEALWSVNHIKEMDKHQLTTRDYLLNNYRLPDDVQDLLINAAYLTAINIKDESIKEVYVHDGNEIVRTQAVGRLRQDIPIVGFYDSKSRETQRANEIKKNQHDSETLNKAFVPKKFLDKPLFDKEKEELLKEIGYPFLFSTLKKNLLKKNYTIESHTKRIRNESKRQSYVVIHEPRS